MRLLEAVRDASESLEKAGIDDHLADAEIISYHAAGIERLAAFLENPEINKQVLSKIRKFISRRAKGEPVQYIVGRIEFCGLEIAVGKGVLIPRPETELLVEEAVKTVRCEALNVKGEEIKTVKRETLNVKRKISESEQEARVSRLTSHVSHFTSAVSHLTSHVSLSFLDLCTGSGCIALALAKEFPEAGVIGTDISMKALNYARRNASTNGITNVSFLRGSLFNPLTKDMLFDLIVSNPPYIRRNEISGLQAEVRDWEPVSALDGGEDGLEFYRKIIPASLGFLKPAGRLLLELGYDQAGQVKELALGSGFTEIEIINDFAGIGRILKARR